MKAARWWALTGAAGLAVSMAAMAPAAAAASSRPSAGLSGPQATIRQHEVGAVSNSTRVNFELVLRLRDAAGAQSLLKAVSTPGSSSYRHYLTTAQWEARFSPTSSAVKTARNWLRSQGFQVGATSQDRITTAASGTAAQVQKAFGTGLAYYKVRGQTVRLTTGSASVPGSISGIAVGAMGLDQTVALPAVASASSAGAATSAPATTSTSPFPPPPAAFITAPPCGSYYGQKIATVEPPFGNGYPATVPYQVCGYKPPQLRSAYNVGSNTGKGTTVAIVDAYGSATIAQDATRYFRMNDPTHPFSSAAFSQHLAIPFTNETLCEASNSWLVEQAIDVEAVHSMATGAHILYAGAKSCLNTDLFNADQYVIDNRLADVVTNSWGDPAGDVLDESTYRAAFDDLFQLAGSTGMTVMFSSGDDGDNFAVTGISAASYPAVSPYVTGVGGTSLQIGSNGQRIGELGWSTGRSFLCTANGENVLPDCTASTLGTWGPVAFDGGSGGYTSYNYAEPYYQVPVVPASLADRIESVTGFAGRVSPDISLDADPATGFFIGLHEIFPNGKIMYGQTRYGGTSVASPLLAGVIADVDAASAAAGRADVGFINPAIYRLSTVPGAIYDVVPGGNQAQLRVDHAFTYITGATGYLYSFRELTYEGPITFCDGTGNCATRDQTLSTAPGYDSMTGLGSAGPDFIADLTGS
jgi:subtilase family serine protease